MGRTPRFAVAGVLTLSSTAWAQFETELRMEASVDEGATWSGLVSARPGQEVFLRLRVIALQGDVTGLAGFVSQPTLSGWNSASDSLRPFDFPGLRNDGTLGPETAYDGRHVFPTPPTSTGRLFPFGSSGMGLGSDTGLLTAFNDPGSVLRFAGSKNVTASTNLAWGLDVSQNPLPLAGTHFAFGSDVVVFRYAVTFGETAGIERTATVGHVLRNTVGWFFNGQGPDLPQGVVITPAVIVPGPGAAGLCAAWGMWSVRRRRGFCGRR